MSLRSPPLLRIASPSWCHRSPLMQPSPLVSSRLAAQPVHVTSLSDQKLTLPSVELRKLIRLKSSALLLVCLGPGSGPKRAPAIAS
eukprot:770089-Pyramimonas_sp.AAC.1